MIYLDFLERAYELDVMNSRNVTRKRNLSARLEDVFQLTDQQFVKSYRLSKDLTRQLIAELTPHIPSNLRSDTLDVTTKVLIALAFYASGSYQSTVGESRKHSVAQASVSKAIRQVTMALNTQAILDKYISRPDQQSEREQIKKDFHNNHGFPGLLGCAGGTHVTIVRPRLNKEAFYNQKGYHSLNVFIICDSNLNILCVDPNSPGSTHDSIVWENHPFNSYLNQLHCVSGEDVYLLGDSRYPLTPTMMTPFANPEPGSPEEYYQDLHLSTRRVVKRCVDVLKARFRCLLAKRRLHYSPDMAAKITNACCVLHNIANKAQIPFTRLTSMEAALEYRLTEGASDSELASEHRSDLSDQGRARRDAIVQYLWANKQKV